MKKLLMGIILTLATTLNAAVYDCFTFFNELELLKMRMHELNSVVDYFVIVEGVKSFTGNDKPLYFQEHASEFKDFSHKVIHLVIKDFPTPTGDEDKDHWNREIYSRNYMLNGLKNCQDTDIILISDLDEIPRATSVTEAVNYLKNMESKRNRIGQRKSNVRMEDFVCDFEMRLFSLSMNREYSVPWNGGCKAIPFWFLKSLTPWEIKIYHHTHTNTKKMVNSGWHFNGMGGDKRVLEKWLNTAPISGAKEYLEQLGADEKLLNETVQSHRDAFTHTVEIDSSYPKYFLENLDYFRSIGWIWE